MKGTWADRDDRYEDMHESETMGTDVSVDRFGLMIRYFRRSRKSISTL